MGSRCCCGCCELSTGANFAAVIGLIECVGVLFWNVLLMILLNGKEAPDILSKLVHLEILEDYDAVHGLTLTSIGLHVIWIIFAIMLLRANASLNRGLLTPWVLMTYLLTLFDIGTTIYFSVKFQGTYVESNFFFDATGRGTKTLTYLTLTVLFSRGVIFWFLNVYLAHVVERRGKEIDHDNSALALYIVSQLSRAAASKEQALTPGPPPAYSASYLSNYLLREEGGGVGDSSWSINQDALQLGFTNPLYYPRLTQVSVTDVRQQASGLPPAYGRSISAEQRLESSTEGVLPY